MTVYSKGQWAELKPAHWPLFISSVICPAVRRCQNRYSEVIPRPDPSVSAVPEEEFERTYLLTLGAAALLNGCTAIG